uniref:PAN domain protein n=1 Tax=Caenorhabditis tropicalis TaxID=1561998 RepID=A0A1I7TB17_9PELO
MRFVFFLCLANLSVIVNASWQCFNVHPSHAVSNSDAIAELFHVTAGECLNYCISQSAQKGDGCVSVVFHRKFSTCQLYGQDGTQNGAEVVYLEDHDFYIRSSWDGQCQDKVVPSRGYKQNIQQINNFKSRNEPPTAPTIENLPKFDNSDFPKDPNPQVIRDNVRKAPVHFENEILQEIERQQMEDEFDMDYMTTTAAPKKKTHPVIITTFRNPAHNYKCQKDETLSYFLVYGSRLSTKMLPQRLNGVDQSSCLMYCSQNINAIGQNIPCYSLNYEPTNEICEMYGKQIRNESDSALLAIDDEHTFGDKFCIKTKNHCDPETLYPVHLYKKLIKDIIAKVPGLDSKVECLKECIENKECKAVTYKKGMCVLHSVSPSDDSSLLLDGNGKTLVIENGCHVSNRAATDKTESNSESEQPESAWQEWSLCQYGVKGRRMRVRQRECNDCDEDMQVEEC